MTDKKFAVVSAVYNVGRYLDDFFAAMDKQTCDHSMIEVILVDDGSTDESPSRLQDWATATDYSVTILTKTNGGQASARNLGLDAVTAEWVTFIDPDDTVADDYWLFINRAVGAYSFRQRGAVIG
ncbi:glycosyltransferase [Brevibacterium sp. FME17]|uniref:glycosyltransferase n=1 Tax=Brevibacterium sp. FME17 TaxID=2742606 RepID=UPI0018690F24|nr:glycosyltransferase [Brevibacterium sp. FME17]